MVRVMSRSARGDHGATGEPWRPTRSGLEEADRQYNQRLGQAITPWYRAGGTISSPSIRGRTGRPLCSVDRGPLSGPRLPRLSAKDRHIGIGDSPQGPSTRGHPATLHERSESSDDEPRRPRSDEGARPADRVRRRAPRRLTRATRRIKRLLPDRLQRLLPEGLVAEVPAALSGRRRGGRLRDDPLILRGFRRREFARG